jgi:hypothetical protein
MTSRIFRNKKREHFKESGNENEMNTKNKNLRDLYRGINEFKKCYQPRTTTVKDENGDLLADSLSGIECHGVNDVMLTEMHTTELKVHEFSSFKAVIAFEKLKIYKSPGTDQILAELIQAGGSILCSAIHELITAI